MKSKIFKFMLMAVTLTALTQFAHAQLTPSGTGPRDPASVRKDVRLFLGADHTVVSFNGVAQTRLVTSGRGVLCGIEINSVSSGGVMTLPLPVTFYDVASVSGVTLAATSLGNANKIVTDQFVGPIGPTPIVSTGGVFNVASYGGTRNNQYATPIQFSNGIVIDHGTVNHGSMTIYWIK